MRCTREGREAEWRRIWKEWGKICRILPAAYPKWTGIVYNVMEKARFQFREGADSRMMAIERSMVEDDKDL